MSSQLNSIEDMLFVIAFLLGSNLVVSIMGIWLNGRKENEDDEFDSEGTNESLSAARMRHPSGQMVLRQRTIYPSGTPEPVLDRQREAEDNS